MCVSRHLLPTCESTFCDTISFGAADVRSYLLPSDLRSRRGEAASVMLLYLLPQTCPFPLGDYPACHTNLCLAVAHHRFGPPERLQKSDRVIYCIPPLRVTFILALTD